MIDKTKSYLHIWTIMCAQSIWIQSEYSFVDFHNWCITHLMRYNIKLDMCKIECRHTLLNRRTNCTVITGYLKRFLHQEPTANIHRTCFIINRNFLLRKLMTMWCIERLFIAIYNMSMVDFQDNAFSYWMCIRFKRFRFKAIELTQMLIAPSLRLLLNPIYAQF